MKRTHFVTASLAVMVLTLAACGSSAPKTLSEDDFVTQMNAICKTADRAITKLDPTDKSYFTDAGDIVQTGLDDLGKLKPPKALASDFNDYVSNLDDTQTQIKKLSKAVKDKDDAATKKASDKLDSLNSDNNDLADSLGADKCVDVGGSAGAPTDTTEPATTEAPQTTQAPETTEAPQTTQAPETTDAPATTDTPNTPLSIDTSVDTTEVVVTTAVGPTTTSGGGTSGGVVATDASQFFEPIAGYTWGTLEDLATSTTPSDNSVLGSVLDSYLIGVMDSDTATSPVFVYVTVLNQRTAWTQPQLDAYYNFELVGDGGVNQSTPGHGFPARVKINSVEGYDGAVFTLDGDPTNGPALGVSLLAPTGTDMLALLDAFADGQSTPMGG